MNPINQLKQTTPVFLVAFLLTCLAIPWSAQAVVPPPDGGYPNGNTAEGNFALQFLTTGTFNTALGIGALFSDTAGLQNTATGAGALFSNTADNNTANGAGALFNNTSGTQNTATGLGALFSNIEGDDNTAVGFEALAVNTGINNTAVGSEALRNNIDAFENTAVGVQALFNNTTISGEAGNGNTAIGSFALFSNTTGDTNTAVGNEALANKTNGSTNTAIGGSALSQLTSGTENIAIGSGAGSTLTFGNNNIYVGNNSGNPGDSNIIRIGGASHSATFIAGISGQAAVGGEAVFVNSLGKLGTLTAVSSQRFKDDLKAMDKDSEAIFALKPVTFRYKKDIEASGIQQFGLVAEQVEKVAPELVKFDHEGKPYTVRYEAVNAMLLNEFLKEHRKVKKLESTVAQQQKQINALVSGLQKVSAQLEVSKTAPQTALNNR